VWVDSGLFGRCKLPEVSIKFASDDYFKLIEKERDLATYFSLGEQIVIVWKGKVYRITSNDHGKLNRIKTASDKVIFDCGRIIPNCQDHLFSFEA